MKESKQKESKRKENGLARKKERKILENRK